MSSLRFFVLVLLAAAAASAQESEYIASHYTKQEAMIPMRDGVRLFTVIYAPKDTSGVYPFLMERTPYSAAPYGAGRYPRTLGPSFAFVTDGFIFVLQDVRGRYMSEGEFINMTPHRDTKRGPRDVDESTDTYDTVEWLLRNVRHNNGKVGVWGISYLGFYASAGTINAHPAISAVSPQAPIADWFIGDDVHHNGAFFLLDNFQFSASFDRIRKAPTTQAARGYRIPGNDAYAFFLNTLPWGSYNQRFFDGEVPFWDSLAVHDTYDDYWKERNILPHLKNMPPAVMVVGGLFDAEDYYGTVATYHAIESNNPRSSNMLVLGPWAHGGWQRGDGSELGDAFFGAATANYFRDSVEFPFFRYHLKGGDTLVLPEALIFETGSNRWRSFDSWPPRGTQTQKVILHTGGTLTIGGESKGRPLFDQYTSDPLRPVPYTAAISKRRSPEYMTEDQRFASERPDVLVYRSAPLSDTLTASGPIDVHFTVTTSGTDCDWVVKVIDAFPDTLSNHAPGHDDLQAAGYQMPVRMDVFRSRFRTSFERPTPMAADKATNLQFRLQDVNHAFLPGHRIMVQIQSSWFPLVDVNPGRFVPVSRAGRDELMKTVQKVRDGSFLIFQVHGRALR